MAKISGRFSRFPAVDRGPVFEQDAPEGLEDEGEVTFETVDVPKDMTIPQTLKWIDGNEDRRFAALIAEESAEEPRSTLLKTLRED